MKGRRTLASRIQTRVAVTVALMALLLAGLTLIVAQTLLTQQLDRDIDSIPLRVQGSNPNPTNPGVQRGTILAGVVDDTAFASVVGAGDVNELEGGVSLLLDLEAGQHTVTLPELGRYRVKVESHGPDRLVIGLPTEGMDQTMLGLTVSAITISVLAVAGTMLVTRAQIRAATGPLRGLTSTAATVSQLPLERGTVAVPRVDIGSLPEEHEVAQVGNAFNHMLDNVEGALVAREASEQKLRRFVADASHELRNPLAAISGYSDLVEKHAHELDDDTSFALGRISSESQRMRKLVADLLTLARLDAEPPATPQPVDAVEVVLNAVSDARAASSQYEWRLVVPEEPVEVLAGSDQLHQVLLNLLGNARTHTPPGTVVVTEVTSHGVISVTDDGPGIPPDVLGSVFERFRRGDEARRHSDSHSTGLGLAIVKAIVESFGGEVGVESRPGRTSFWLRLPLRTPAEMPELTLPSPPSGSPT